MSEFILGFERVLFGVCVNGYFLKDCKIINYLEEEIVFRYCL